MGSLYYSHDFRHTSCIAQLTNLHRISRALKRRRLLFLFRLTSRTFLNSDAPILMQIVVLCADGSSEHTSDGDTNGGEEAPGKALVIPEKASSFSIHPGRLCKDECSYCFGKFGLFDTPCHIAQMKSVERQDKILASKIQRYSFSLDKFRQI